MILKSIIALMALYTTTSFACDQKVVTTQLEDQKISSTDTKKERTPASVEKKEQPQATEEISKKIVKPIRYSISY